MEGFFSHSPSKSRGRHRRASASVASIFTERVACGSSSHNAMRQIPELDGDLPEGADVTLIASDGEATFHVDAELEAVLLQSIAQGELGETIAAEDLIEEMRGRE